MNGQFRIDTLTAFIALDKDGTEGVVGTMAGGQWTPFIGADHARVMSLFPEAQKIAKAGKIKITVARFSVRENLEEILP